MSSQYANEPGALSAGAQQPDPLGRGELDTFGWENISEGEQGTAKAAAGDTHTPVKSLIILVNLSVAYFLSCRSTNTTTGRGPWLCLVPWIGYHLIL